MVAAMDIGGKEEGGGNRLCPQCDRTHVFRSRRRGLCDWLLHIVRLYPLRCDHCGHRFRRVTWRGR
jgi:hypothetical protein